MKSASLWHWIRHHWPRHDSAALRASGKGLLYIVMCHVDWFVCVISGAHGAGWIGVLTTAAMLVYHVSFAARPREELKLITVAVCAGAIWESAMVRSGWLVYPSGILIPGTAPYWLLALWALFALQFNVLLRWLKQRLWLASLIGAIAGPLSFRGGAALGAVHFSNNRAALIALACGWAVLTPAMMALARRWDGISERSPDGVRQA